MKRITFTRRAALALGGASLLVKPSWGQQDYPNRPISFVCAFPPGSGADVLVRYFANAIGKVSGATTIVENRPGAAGNIATEYTSRSQPDGYTIFPHAGSTIAANMHLFKKPPVDVRTALQTVAFINKQAFMIVVRTDHPAKDIKDLTAIVKKKGTDASYGWAATPGRILGILYNNAAGLEAVDISYKSSPDSSNDLLSGVLEYAVYDPQYAMAERGNGRVRVLALGSAQRIDAVPDIPTLKEYGYDVDQIGWWGAWVAAGTPRPVVDKINGWFENVLKLPETKKFLNSVGGEVFIGTPDEGQKLLVESVDVWRDFVKLAKIEPN
jgi:tripartite-type tricarboxylate transporter receptor subunit TctC